MEKKFELSRIPKSPEEGKKSVEKMNFYEMMVEAINFYEQMSKVKEEIEANPEKYGMGVVGKITELMRSMTEIIRSKDEKRITALLGKIEEMRTKKKETEEWQELRAKKQKKDKEEAEEEKYRPSGLEVAQKLRREEAESRAYNILMKQARDLQVEARRHKKEVQDEIGGLTGKERKQMELEYERVDRFCEDLDRAVQNKDEEKIRELISQVLPAEEKEGNETKDKEEKREEKAQEKGKERVRYESLGAYFLEKKWKDEALDQLRKEREENEKHLLFLAEEFKKNPKDHKKALDILNDLGREEEAKKTAKDMAREYLKDKKAHEAQEILRYADLEIGLDQL